MSSTTAAATNNDVANANGNSAANDVSRLDDMVRAKVGAGVGTDFIPTWDQSRVEEGMMVSFLDDPLPENQRIKLASRLIGGPGSLVLALCPDAPSHHHALEQQLCARVEAPAARAIPHVKIGLACKVRTNALRRSSHRP